MDRMPVIPLLVVVVAVIAAAATDLMQFKIHNRLTLPLLAFGLIYHAVADGLIGFLDSSCGAALGFGFLFIFYLAGGMGGGDVKLLASLGAWLGIRWTFWIVMVSFLVTGVYAVFLMVMNRENRAVWTNFKIMWTRWRTMFRFLGGSDAVETEVKREGRRKRLIPFAAMVAVAVLMTMIWFKAKGAP